jgi:hypothetical protein
LRWWWHGHREGGPESSSGRHFADAHPDSDAYSDTDSHAESVSFADADPESVPDADSHADAEPVADSNADAHPDADSDPHAVADQHRARHFGYAGRVGDRGHVLQLQADRDRCEQRLARLLDHE